MAATLDLSRASAQQHGGQIDVQVPVAVAQGAPVKEDRVIQQAAVAVGS